MDRCRTCDADRHADPPDDLSRVILDGDAFGAGRGPMRFVITLRQVGVCKWNEPLFCNGGERAKSGHIAKSQKADARSTLQTDSRRSG